MTIHLLFFGITADLVGSNSFDYTIHKPISIQKFKEQLVNDYKVLKNINDFAIAVNEEYATDELILQNNDEVAIIPPVSGG
ncbi:MAG: MoaD/ThiS family protein [Lutibacter sp.]|jgi:molybdopterin converting factor subunit 1|uniref:MoaD/ThiS family protein n=1 Tax=Lutibacter sp. TaxID=1925666 RepID=UPI00299D1F82|nr:MoaD/ThiS family protein [Lutibacter sp.]MDX1828525.1 MoaD/ThiS family protein [Lutibacter sp.]